MGAHSLVLSYPDWATRYVVRRRSSPRGPVVETYPAGRDGLAATNGVLSIVVPLSQSSSFFELYLPAANR